MRYRSPIVFFVLALAALLIYSNTFSYPFVFDDGMYIVGNRGVHALSNFWPPVGTRYLGYLSFAVNYSLGGVDTTGYHIVNTFIHVLNGILVYLLVTLTFKTPWMEGAGIGDKKDAAFALALISSVIFIVHPVQTQAVTYVTQRFASLATLFYLLSLVLYIRWRASGNGRWVYVLAVITTVSAQMTKEISFTLPFLIALYELMFFSGPCRKRFWYLIPFLLTLLVIPLSLLSPASGGLDLDVSENIREKQVQELVSLSPYQYFSTQLRVIVTYLRLLALPVKQTLDYDYPRIESFFAPEALISFFFLLSIAIAAVAVFLRARRIKEPFLAIISLGVFWFFITLSIESSVIPIQDVIFEHRLYLPSVGAFMAASAVIVYLLSYLKGKGAGFSVITMAVVALAMLSVPLGAASYKRNLAWKDELTLWKDTVEKSPGKTRPHNNLGDIYFRMGRMDEAIAEFEAAKNLKPDVKTFFNLGSAYYKKGRLEESIAELKTAIGLKPDFADAHYNLAAAYRAAGMMDGALAELEAAVRYKPDKWNAHYNLGLMYQSRGRVDDARREFATVIALKPDFAEARDSLRSLGR
ncbi:MAG: tetratricopeptide repeat protein [Deltaproteobacteria bacterium]|nr:tetratricopeptide repeat protein [Deltaproteobacteria bacterium]